MNVERIKCDQCGKEHPKGIGMLGEHNLIGFSMPPTKMSKLAIRKHFDFCDRACLMRFIADLDATKKV